VRVRSEVLAAVLVIVVAGTAACGSSDSAADESKPAGPRTAEGADMCGLLPADRMAELLGVATLEPHPDQKPDSCGWTAPVTGGAGGQLSVSSGPAGFAVSGDPLTVGGLRAHKQYNSTEKSCAVTVITAGAIDPAGEESIYEKGVRVWFLSTPGPSPQQICDAASRLANALVHALPKA